MSEHCILTVEDQEDLAALYETTLKAAGYRVVSAYTGEEAIAEFKANGADLILLDMTLPEMHGTQVLSEVRALSPSVPVIVVTGETGQLWREQCERLGVYGFLSKPIDYNALLAMIGRALEAPSEEAEIITVRIPKRIVEQLSAIDSNLERAITRLVDEGRQEASQMRAASDS
ncbi:MAG TPA: response regulator [Pyrinomonadaceae bacterium]|nr:response regulator [Pyrinomonadaceae bacterium]